MYKKDNMTKLNETLKCKNKVLVYKVLIPELCFYLHVHFKVITRNAFATKNSPKCFCGWAFAPNTAGRLYPDF